MDKFPSTETLRNLFDFKDGHLWWKAPGLARQRNKPAGYLDSYGYIQIMIDHKSYKEHNLIWKIARRLIPPDMTLDHLNGIRDDNHLENLVPASRSTNHRNRQNAKYCSFLKRTQKWMARGWSLSGERIHLGCFSTEVEAIHIGKTYAVNRLRESRIKDLHSFRSWHKPKLDTKSSSS